MASLSRTNAQFLKFYIRNASLMSAILEPIWLRQTKFISNKVVTNVVFRVRRQIIILLFSDYLLQWFVHFSRHNHIWWSYI